jgi:hypothetical protein
MSVSKRALLATIASVAMALSTVAMAQTPGSKSNPVTTIGEGEAVMIHPKTHVVHKSNIKVSAAKHVAALAKGAREISGGTVIYKQGGKLYMMEDSANEKASSSFQSNFDVDY